MGSNGKGNGSRKRPFALMALVAFGVALLGVLLLNKFRERRIFNLLLKEKDTDLLSLHLLLQKQIDRSKEMEKTKEEMKAKLYLLRTQKMELNRKLIEMQSTIGILKEEQRTMEAAFEEKQKERENPQLLVLNNILKQKEDEIQDLKHHLQSVAKFRSGDPDKASNHSGNQTEISVIESTLNRVAENASMGDNGRERKSIEAIPAETRVETGTEKAVDGVHGERVEDSQDQSSRGNDRKEKEITIDGREELQSEIGKHGYKRGAKEKRWRYIAKKRKLDDRVNNNDESASIRSRKFYNEDESKSKSLQVSSNEKKMEEKMQNSQNHGGNHKSENRENEDSKRVNNISELEISNEIANGEGKETDADISESDFSEEAVSEMEDD